MDDKLVIEDADFGFYVMGILKDEKLLNGDII